MQTTEFTSNAATKKAAAKVKGYVFIKPETRPTFIEPHTIIRARFAPSRLDDLKADALAAVGETLLFYVWGEYDSGQFKGQQQADTAVGAFLQKFRGHVPLCDLQDIEIRVALP